MLAEYPAYVCLLVIVAIFGELKRSTSGDIYNLSYGTERRAGVVRLCNFLRTASPEFLT
jgi:hypothetical protein